MGRLHRDLARKLRPQIRHNLKHRDSNVEDVLTAASTIDQALGYSLMDTIHFVSNAFNFEAHALSVMTACVLILVKGVTLAQA